MNSQSGPTSPLVFEPYLRPQVWGDRRLETYLRKPLPAQGTFGESWEVSGHPHHVSRVAEGPWQGARLDDLWNQHRASLLGSDQPSLAKFPLLIKFLDCHQQLSVQVHPNDETAAELLGDELGKTEAWVVLHAEPNGRIYAGLKEGTTRQDLERHLDAGTVAECLHSFAPRAGDCVFLSAGTVHALGDGVLMAEVQQSSDATFRLFDWNRLGTDGRPRKLHREEALRSIDWNAGPVSPIQPQPVAKSPSGIRQELLAQCCYFELDRFVIEDCELAVPSGEMTIWMMLSGNAELRSEDGTYHREFHVGQCVLLPAAAPPLTWASEAKGSCTLLRTRLPA